MSDHHQNGSAPKRFSKRRVEIPFEIEEKDGAVTPYVLKALDGPGREDFMSFMAAKARLDKSGNPTGLKDMKGMTLRLLSHTVFKPDGSPVPEAEIATWPGPVQGELFDDAQRISGLNKRAEEEAKNE